MDIFKYITDYIRTYLSAKTGFIFFVTNRCNAKCRHCFYSKMLNYPKQELSIAEIERLARHLKQGRNSIIITGGEPFLREDLADIVKILVDSGITGIVINSNGIAVENILKTVERISCLRGINLSINISIDGSRDMHDKIRNFPGAFDRAVATIKELQKIGVRVGILMNLNALNYKEIGDAYNFCISQFNIKPNLELIRGVMVSGVSGEEASDYYEPCEPGLLINKDNACEIRKAMRGFYSRRIMIEPLKLFVYSASLARIECLLDVIEKRTDIFRCYAGDKHGVIYENAEVALCEMMKPIGSLRQLNFNIWEIWHNARADSQRKMVSRCYCTHSCFINVIYSPYFLVKFIFMFFSQLFQLARH